MKNLVMAVLLLCFAIFSVTQPPKDKGVAVKNGTFNATPSSETKKNQQNARDTPNQTIAIYNQPSPTEHSDDDRQNKDAIDVERKLAKFTLYLVIVGFLQVAVLVVQAVLFWQQKNIMDQHKVSFEKLANAASDNAVDAKDSAEFARRTTKSSERSDILVESFSIATGNVKWTQNGDGKLIVRFRNFGRTRATEVRLRVELVIPELNLVRGKYELPIMVLGREQEQAIATDTFHDCLTFQVFAEVIKGQRELRFTAFASYEDVFGDSHTTMDIGVFDTHTNTFKIIQKIAG